MDRFTRSSARTLTRIGIVLAGLIAATAVLPQAQTLTAGKISHYLIVSGDTSSGSWDTQDESRIREWRSRYGSRFAWFQQDGRDYIIADAATLDRIQDAMAPQMEVNHRQSVVNRRQNEVNRMQAVVNAHQRDVNRLQGEVNRRQSLVNHGQAEQTEVNRMQSEVNSKQSEVNAEQQKVNREQDVVNKEQAAVNEMQRHVSTEIREALQHLFDSARVYGLAHEAR